MASELGGALELIFSQSHRPVAASLRLGESWFKEFPTPASTTSSYGTTAFPQGINKFSLYIAHHDPAGIALSESIEASSLNRQTGTFLRSQIVAESLRRIEARYIITEGKEWVRGLLYTQRDLSRLLLDAVLPLRNAFGDRLVRLQGISDGDDVSLAATVQWQDDAESARAARSNFDQHWWLDNCNRAHGYLVFDYELVDAV